MALKVAVLLCLGLGCVGSADEESLLQVSEGSTELAAEIEEEHEESLESEDELEDIETPNDPRVNYIPNDKFMDHIKAKVASKSNASSGCECLPWAEVYANRSVTCGQGLEFFFDRLKENTTELQKNDKKLKAELKKYGQKFCDLFFTQTPYNYCVNQNFYLETKLRGEQWYTGSWCYVDSKCTELDGGRAIPETDVSWKVCDRSKDLVLRDFTVKEIFDLAALQHVDPALLPSLAYWYNDKNAGRLVQFNYTRIKKFGEPVHMFAKSKAKKAQHLVVSKDQSFRLRTKGPFQVLDKEAADGWKVECETGCEFYQYL